MNTRYVQMEVNDSNWNTLQYRGQWTYTGGLQPEGASEDINIRFRKYAHNFKSKNFVYHILTKINYYAEQLVKSTVWGGGRALEWSHNRIITVGLKQLADNDSDIMFMLIRMLDTCDCFQGLTLSRIPVNHFTFCRNHRICLQTLHVFHEFKAPPSIFRFFKLT